MKPRIFFSVDSRGQLTGNFQFLLREAVALLFPRAIPFDWPDRGLGPPSSFFLREGDSIFWVEAASGPFTRNHISDYLGKARQIQSVFPLPVTGVLVAPQFEAGIEELLELIRIPIRLFRCQEVFPLAQAGHLEQESALCLEELTPRPSSARISVAEPTAGENHAAEIPAMNSSTSWNRLSREELREFIQFELDVAHRPERP